MKVNAGLFPRLSGGGWVDQLSSLRQIFFSGRPFVPSARSAVMPLDMHMHQGEIVRLDKQHRGQQIQVRDGTIWLTGVETGDVLLGRGQTFTLKNQSPFVVQALTEANWIVGC
ncbi:MAG: hypothetical protein JWM16_5845 [Verrucomicrobiales bacterium]|nr:hypothetical protein [Verrucomicrobiales bacterium]